MRRRRHPQEFQINGATPEEQAARQQRAEERRRRLLDSVNLHAEQGREQRWPYTGSRASVKPTPPPDFAQPDLLVGDTLASRLRQQVGAWVCSADGLEQTY
jgi:hypothetical protein